MNESPMEFARAINAGHVDAEQATFARNRGKIIAATALGVAAVAAGVVLSFPL